jgi:transcriptional regulator with GAF, ATPase, and Fis domain
MTVLVLGETGTGKELVARLLHEKSGRRERPLVKVNCSALPAELIESELFGHERGAFTGAVSKQVGRFELADGGTIFLDEVGELPLRLQSKLLRVLQEGEFERVGSGKTVKVDVRVIAATNRNLHAQVEAGSFRSDLYYRLNVFPIVVPPLRERRDDIPGLVRHFAAKAGRKLGRTLGAVSPAFVEQASACAWPGNIRELENFVERAMIMSTSAVLDAIDQFPPAATPEKTPAVAPEDATLVAMERAHIRRVLEHTRWIIEGERGAARMLDLHPSTLRNRLRKLGIRKTP